MRFLIWCVGALEILTALMLSRAVAPWWWPVWVTLAVLWVLCGCVVSLLSVVRMATKGGGVNLPGFSVAKGKSTPTHKVED